MNLLAIDTSTEQASVALLFEGKLYQQQRGNFREHAQFILPMIDSLFSEAGCAIKQLDGVVFGRGPGSFTGLRIACSVAKGLAYAHDLPLYPVSSLQAIACDADADVAVLSMIDARMGQVYWDVFYQGLTGQEERVTEASDVQCKTGHDIVLAGFGFEAYYASLPDTVKSQVIDKRVLFPDASAMIRIVKQGLCQSVTADAAQPVYVRNQVTHGGSNG